MGHHSNFDWSDGGSSNCGGGMDIPTIPMPMAIVGMWIAFAFGATIGMVLGKKHSSGMDMGKPGMMWGGKHKAMMWGKGGPHHHHAQGGPACWEQHGEMSDASQMMDQGE